MERAGVIGKTWGMDIHPLDCERAEITTRELKLMDKAVDGILEEYEGEPSGRIGKIFGSELIEKIKSEKSLPMRIRRKGMLVQSVMWLDTFNIVLV